MVIWVGQGSVTNIQTIALEAAGFDVERVAFLADGAVADDIAIDESRCDAIILAGVDPATRLKQISVHKGRVPTVIAFVSTTIELIDALHAGADDAIFVDISTDELCLRARIWRERAELKRDNLRLLQLAFHDELTGLGNRRSLHSRLDYALEYAARHGGAVATLVADLDGMKHINDTAGHPAGDAALVKVSEIIKRSLRTIDLATRVGGDEFVIVLPATDAIAAARVAERIRQRVEALIFEAGLKMTVSFGVAAVDDVSATKGLSSDDLLARADRALYNAKRAGKNRIEVATFDTHAA